MPDASRGFAVRFAVLAQGIHGGLRSPGGLDYVIVIVPKVLVILIIIIES